MAFKNPEQSGKVSLGMRCGDCLHFDTTRTFEDVCSNLGVEDFARACGSFTPNTHKLARVGDDKIEQLGRLCRNMGTSQLRLMAFTFRTLSFIHKAGFKFGQPIVINVSAPLEEYVECYYKGYIFGADKTGENVYITADINKDKKNPVVVTLPSKSEGLLKLSQWKSLRDKLIATNHIKLPSDKKDCLWINRPKIEVKSVLEDDYEIPTIDTVPESWLYGRGTSKRRNAPAPRKAKIATLEKKMKKSGKGIIVNVD